MVIPVIVNHIFWFATKNIFMHCNTTFFNKYFPILYKDLPPFSLYFLQFQILYKDL
jgi:hypothetical protein